MIPSKALASSPATHNFDGASNGSKLTYFKLGKIVIILTVCHNVYTCTINMYKRMVVHVHQDNILHV